MHQVEQGVAQLQSGMASASNQTYEPRYFKLPVGAAHPLIYDQHIDRRIADPQVPRTLFWSSAAIGALAGPYDIGFNVQFAGGKFASDRGGRTLISGERTTTDGTGIQFLGSDGKGWQARIFEQVQGAAPRLLEQDLQQALEWPNSVFWSDILGGFLISSETPKDSASAVTFRSSLLMNGRVSPLDDRGIDLAVDLPRLGVAALLDFNSLRFVEPDGRVEWVAPLNSGDDYNGWEGLHEAGDGGWLYIDGVEYDHAVHVAELDGAWRATSIVRITEDRGLVNAILWWLLGDDADRMKRWGLSDIIRAGTCRNYSAAIKRMIFCDDMSELRGGKLARIGDGKVTLKEFLGDVERFGLAMFLGRNGRLYSYDGETLRAVAGAAAERGLVQEVAATGRAFLSTRSALFELRGGKDALELVQLTAPASVDFFFARFQEAPASTDVVVFLREGIYLVDGDGLAPLWPSASFGMIDIAGFTTPVQIAGWGGTLFTTSDNAEGPPRFHLLTPCAAK